MAFRHAALRFANLENGYRLEYMQIFAMILLFISCVSFIDGFEHLHAHRYLGGWLFMISMLLQLAFVINSLHEVLAARKHMTARFNDDDRHEVMEHVLYLVSNSIFFLGSVLMLPEVSNGPIVEEISAWCLICGSLGLCMASYFNALGLTADRFKFNKHSKRQKAAYQMNCVALGLQQLGGVFFACGSFLFRPVFTRQCNYTSVDSAGNNAAALFVVGALIFLAESAMGFVVRIISLVDGSDLEARGSSGETTALLRGGQRDTIS